MTPDEIRKIISDAGITQKQAAEKIGVSHGTLRNALTEKPKKLGKSAELLLLMIKDGKL